MTGTRHHRLRFHGSWIVMFTLIIGSGIVTGEVSPGTDNSTTSVPDSDDDWGIPDNFKPAHRPKEILLKNAQPVAPEPKLSLTMRKEPKWARIFKTTYYGEIGFAIHSGVDKDVANDWGLWAFAGYRYRFFKYRKWGFTPELGGRLYRIGLDGYGTDANYDGTAASIIGSIDAGTLMAVYLRAKLEVGTSFGRVYGTDAVSQSVDPLVFGRAGVEAGLRVFSHAGIGITINQTLSSRTGFDLKAGSHGTVSLNGTEIGLMAFLQF